MMRLLLFLLLASGAMVPGATAQVADPLALSAEAYQAGRYAEAARHAQDAVRQRPGLMQAHLALAAARLQAGDAGGAGQAAASALQRFPGDPVLTALHADALIAQERYSAAIPLLDAIVRNPPEGVTPEAARARAAQVRVAAAIRASGAERRLALAQEARQLAPGDLVAVKLEASALLELGRAPEAREVVAAALARAPGDADLLRLAAQADAASGDAEALASSAGRLAEAAPDDLGVALLAGRAQLASGETERAAETFSAVLDRFAASPEAYRGVATAYEQAGFVTGAVGVLERWRRIAPGDTAVVSRLADALALSAEPVAAEAMLDTLRAMGGSAAWALRRAARAHALLDRYADAARLYEAAFDASGADADARAAIRAADLAGDFDAHIRVAERWRDRAPSPEARAAYALALPLPQARTPMRDLASGDDPLVLLRLAMWYENAPQALQAARLALEISARGREEAQAQLADSGLPTGAAPVPPLERPGLDPGTASGVADAALILAADLDAPLALAALDSLLTADPDTPRLHAFRGRALARLGRDGDAREAFERASRLAPEAFVVQRETAQFYESREEWDAATLAWERAAALDGPEAYGGLIRAHRARGSLDALADRWLARLRTTARDEALRQAAIEALHKAGRADEARALAGQN